MYHTARAELSSSIEALPDDMTVAGVSKDQFDTLDPDLNSESWCKLAYSSFNRKNITTPLRKLTIQH